MDIQKVLRRRIILFNLTEKSLTALARMGGIFITVGDLFACGKADARNSARGGGTSFRFSAARRIFGRELLNLPNSLAI